ncbi:MAG: methyltransferase domain-containing protein [Proteobacteria bacterium]|nr:methyltransferase domain-containing protein [Pseudomonadota bacterium]
MRRLLLWRLKILAKIILSRLPFGYAFWKRLTLFEHGRMDDPAYAMNVFKRHFSRCEKSLRSDGFVGLELGPGDSLSSALIFRAFGASKVFLVDTGDFAGRDMESYCELAQHLRRVGYPAPSDDALGNVGRLLEACGAEYLTQGLDSLRSIADNSVDFIWSQAVLEHIRKRDFVDTLSELRRIMRKDGICSHRIDLRDHLDFALNNLRFKESLWETEFLSGSGFYTNRIRYGEMLDLFNEAGFRVVVCDVDYWSELPTPRKRMAEPFRSCPDSDLLVKGFDVMLYPNAG